MTSETTLDNLTIKILELTQDLVQTKIHMEKYTKEGHFLLAKARYSMGGASVSRLQLPCENADDFEANFKVYLQRDAINELDVKHGLFHHYVVNSQSKSESVEGVKKRKDPPSSLTSCNNPKVDDLDQKRLNHNPLRWFGLLTPPVLKQSQQCFQKALELSLECANLQCELTAVMKQKNQLMKAQI